MVLLMLQDNLGVWEMWFWNIKLKRSLRLLYFEQHFKTEEVIVHHPQKQEHYFCCTTPQKYTVYNRFPIQLRIKSLLDTCQMVVPSWQLPKWNTFVLLTRKVAHYFERYFKYLVWCWWVISMRCIYLFWLSIFNAQSYITRYTWTRFNLPVHHHVYWSWKADDWFFCRVSNIFQSFMNLFVTYIDKFFRLWIFFYQYQLSILLFHLQNMKYKNNTDDGGTAMK